MHRFHLALAAAMTLLALPATSAAKSHKVDVTATAKFEGGKLAVVISGKPLGRCKGTAELTSTGSIFRAKCKEGKIVVRVTFKNGDPERGTWKVSAGTGTYKGSKGKGNFTGNNSTLKYRMTGSISY